MDAPFATKFVIVSDPEALDPERTNSMDNGPAAAMFSGSIPPKSATVNDIKPDEPEMVFSTSFAASAKRMTHLRVPPRVET